MMSKKPQEKVSELDDLDICKRNRHDAQTQQALASDCRFRF
jgi:hypothetical protein